MYKILIDKEVNYVMFENNKNSENKMCLTQLLKETAKESGVKFEVVKAVYSAMIKVLVQNLVKGFRIGLTGFGSFYLQKHKGHPIQFNDTKSSIDDYVVVKFTASGSMKKKIDNLVKREDEKLL